MNMRMILGVIAAAMALAGCVSGPKVDNTPVAVLDLNRYLGEWYEIARFDHSFERGVEQTKANYTQNADGTIKVVNSGVKDGKPKTAIGKGKTTDTPGLLRVSFFGPFYADYRVMLIDKDYTRALVGSGSADYLWILSRTPSLDGDAKVAILDEIHRRGYDAKKLIWVKQDEIIECPEIKSDGFSLEMPELEDRLRKVRLVDRKAYDKAIRKAEDEDGNVVRPDLSASVKVPDAAVVRDAVRSAIEATGRFGKERDVNKRDGGLAMCVRIVEQEWHTKKDPSSPYETCYLQIKIEVVTHYALNNFIGYYASRRIGNGSERLYVCRGTASNIPPTIDRYVDTIAGAVKNALCDLHPCPERIKGERQIAWKELGDFADPKKLEERYRCPHIGQVLSPLGKPVADFDVYNRMKEIRLPSVSLRPPATLMDAMLFFQACAIPFDGSGEAVLFAVFPAKEGDAYPVVPEFSANNISLLDALKRVTESVGAYMCFRCDGVVEVKPKPKSIKQFFDKHLSWSGKELDKHDQ